LHRDVYLLHDALVDVSYDLLNHLELLEQFASSFKNVLRENVFLTVYPEIGESFLSGVEDLSEVAKASLLVENFVGLRKLFSILSGGAHGFEPFAKPLNLVKKSFAGSLSIF
jgi:hypothetical protein